MKLLIKLSIAIIVLLLLVIGGLLVLVNPNDYKNEIQLQVKETINRDLHINGDLSWTFFPHLGFSSGEIVLDNLAGFSKPQLLKIDKASLGIDILPLLKGEISIGELTLDGFELTLLTDKNGLSNLDNMGAQSTSTAPATDTAEDSSPSTTTEDSFFKMDKAQLAGININNAVIEVEDLQAGSYQNITVNEIKLGQFALDKETPLSINTQIIIDDLQAQISLSALLLVNSELSNIKLNQLHIDTQLTADALPNGQLQSQLKTDINVALTQQQITVKQLAINTTVTGNNLPNKKITTQLNADIDYLINEQLATVSALSIKVDDLELDGNASIQTQKITKVRYDLIANQWDLNPYLTKSDETQKNESEAGSAPSNDQQSAPTEPDLSFLHDLDVNGKLKIAGVLVDNIKIGEINNRLIIKKGKAYIAPLTVALYEGLLTANGNIDESKGKNRYQFSTKLKDVQLKPLLSDAAQLEILSGTTAFTFNGRGEGVSKIKQGLIGKGTFKLLDGELYGVNIHQEIRAIKAKITGKAAPTSDAIKKTDFASLAGKFSIEEGVVDNQKLLMLSPVMRLDGAGLINILSESLDYKLSITPLSSSSEDTDYVDLTGLTIPMLIKGDFSDPKISLDTDGALKEHLKAKLDAETDRLKEKALKGDLDADSIKKEGKRLEDTLKSFF